MLITKISLLIVIIILNLITCNAAGLSDILNSAKNIATGTAKKLPDFLPTPKFLVQTTKEIVAGYPFEVALKAINQLCSAALSADAIEPRVSPDIKNMSFVLMTPKENFSFPLMEAKSMWGHSAFDPTKKVVILTTGWTTDLKEPRNDINTLAEAYFCRGDSNFVVVDSARFIDTLYTWSAFNTEEIGESIGKGLAELIKVVPRENIHLIGHSLGAHISGVAGRSFTFHTGELLPRITGLDPANPCFNEGEALTGLQRGDAEFVDVIHTNSRALGQRDPLGDVDFYPGGVTSLPPGCLDISCAHLRAWRYYAESVRPGNEMNFMGVKCSALYKLNSGKCLGEPAPMGYMTPSTIKGNYFLDVNAAEPFGKNATRNQQKCA
ncbi:vitellogenin-2-like [Hermetia illucens]|nr:vitellogenin-2-like [Hermetia illucens]XP_037921198.1 vitellogenin-2-like [Hermetia illucens]